ncbi:MAG: copper resistance protein CopC, partial [Gemmatimonadaceae bacterium]
MTAAQWRRLIQLPASLRWLVFAAAIIALAPRTAFAHAHLVKSAPAANSHLSVPPTQLQLWFTEAADAEMTILTVTSSNGERIPLGSVTTDKRNSLLLSAPFT